ncbi:YtpI family protein [Aneurinibacillus thermoaerophilus]|uniref:YtpI family protein n=1 Tax=Aneurinibacillus thermoaerophilus TaxID=143495 RepID=UPI002E1E0322|nr:YtpI family protein [Aneurinibacillus thermoaerophilus]MED0765646.1 YtpI family protein [Aneurinibacillus thermoaerophilus]
MPLSSIFTIFIILSATIAIYYAITWRSQPGVIARIYQARMNIGMGIFLLGVGTNQLMFDDVDTIRLVIGIILLFIGAVNLIMGIRNLTYFTKLKREQQNKR